MKTEISEENYVIVTAVERITIMQELVGNLFFPKDLMIERQRLAKSLDRIRKRLHKRYPEVIAGE